MLAVDPAAAAREIRRVLRTGGNAAIAVWDARERNPWATIPTNALIELGHAEPPDPDAPGPFALATDGALAEVLEDAGFTEVDVVTGAAAAPLRHHRRRWCWRAPTSRPASAPPTAALTDEQQAEVAAHMASGAAPFTDDDGSVTLPGVSLVARAVRMTAFWHCTLKPQLQGFLVRAPARHCRLMRTWKPPLLTRDHRGGRVGARHRLGRLPARRLRGARR